MKFYTSYFYQIRNFTPNMIPLSTACSDPSWFHQGQDKLFVFTDKRGVINGLRAEMLHPDFSCSNLCKGSKNCSDKPENCEFLKKYIKQLEKIDFEKFLDFCGFCSDFYNRTEEDTIIVLIVHEAWYNPCSERIPLQNWIKVHGYECREWLHE